MKEDEQPVMKDVDEPYEGRVCRVMEPLVGVFGEVAREWPTGPPEAEEADRQSRESPVGPRAALHVVGELGPGEVRRRRLPDPDALLGGSLRFSEARAVRV